MASSPFSHFCAEDYNGWGREALVNCELPLLASGAVETDAELDAFASSNGWAGEGFFWSNQGDLVDNISVPKAGAGCAPCTSLTQKAERWHKFQANKCWQLPELQKACNRTGAEAGDELQAVATDYGRSLLARVVLASMHGIYQSNKMQDSSDLIVYASLLPVAQNFVSRYAAISAEEKVGCGGDDMPMMLMHSDVYNNLRKDGQITLAQVNCDDGNCINRAFFEGKMVEHVKSDLLKDGTSYITAMFRSGAFGVGRADLDNALTEEYDDCADGGTGALHVYTRDRLLVHPRGFSNQFNADGSATTVTPTIADLILPATWERSWEASNSNIAFIASTEV